MKFEQRLCFFAISRMGLDFVALLVLFVSLSLFFFLFFSLSFMFFIFFSLSFMFFIFFFNAFSPFLPFFYVCLSRNLSLFKFSSFSSQTPWMGPPKPEGLLASRSNQMETIKEKERRERECVREREPYFKLSICERRLSLEMLASKVSSSLTFHHHLKKREREEEKKEKKERKKKVFSDKFIEFDI